MMEEREARGPPAGDPRRRDFESEIVSLSSARHDAARFQVGSARGAVSKYSIVAQIIHATVPDPRLTVCFRLGRFLGSRLVLRARPRGRDTLARGTMARISKTPGKTG